MIIMKTDKNSNKQEKIESLKHFIYFSKYLTQSNWKYIEQEVDSLQKNFIRKIRSLYPSLTEDDIHIILLLRIGFTNKEITIICGILLESFRKRRYRLKKKMNIECDSICDFIRELHL